MVSFVVLIIPI